MFKSLLIGPKLTKNLRLALRIGQVTVKELHQNNEVSINIRENPSRNKKKERHQNKKLVNKLQELLNCTRNEADNLIEQNKMLRKTSVCKMSENIEFLIDKKISATTIKNNLSLLGNPMGKRSL